MTTKSAPATMDSMSNVSANKLRYQIDVSGAKLGMGDYQVNPLRITEPPPE